MMINIIIVHSKLESIKSVKVRLEETLNEISTHNGDVKILGYYNDEEKLKYELKNIGPGLIIFPASGGTEKLMLSALNNAYKPVLICANSQKNSFAAALETFAFFKNEFPVSLFYWDTVEELKERIDRFILAVNTIEKLNNSNVGIIGQPSDWLLTSKGIDSFGSFRTKLIHITTDELINFVNSEEEEQNEKTIKDIISKYPSITVDKNSINYSGKVYFGMKSLIYKYDLNALTIRCFDLLDYKYTACLGMSICNDEGIISGCEGGLHALFSMMIGNYLTREPCWMANPSSIDKMRNELILAHCTVPSRFLENLNDAELTTHMESGLSTAITGSLQKKEVTIFRTGGSFNKMLAIKGSVVDSNMQNMNLCRTQAVIKLDGNMDSWLQNSLGNHQVIVYGDITELLKEFCDLSNIEFISI